MEKFGTPYSSEKTIAILGDKMLATKGESGRGYDKQKHTPSVN